MGILNRILLYLAAIILSLLLKNANSEALPHNDLLALDAKISEVLDAHHIASISYAIVQPEQALHIRSIGVADMQTQRSISPETPYRIASVSKMVVGIAIMQLVESGQLSLNDTLSALLPDMVFHNPWANSHPLQLVHLVENTTGWNEIPMHAFAYPNDPPLALADALALVSSSFNSRWPPGTRHAYTNSTAAVAALIVEQTTGISFERYAQQYIFAPLGMDTADYSSFPEQVASGHWHHSRPYPYKPVVLTPAGGLSISVSDAARLLQALLTRSEALLSADSYARIEQSRSTNVGTFAAGYGVFNYARFYQGYRFRGHDGALRGWRSEFSYAPDMGVGFVVLQNSENNAAFRTVVTLISDYLINHYADKPGSASAALQNPGAEARPDIGGYYRYQNPRIAKRFFLERLIASYKFSHTATGDRFSSVIPPGWRRDLRYTGNGQWQNDKGEVVMVQASDPMLGDVLHYGDRVFVAESAFSAWSDKIILLLWLLSLLLLTPAALFWLVRLLKLHQQQGASKQVRYALILGIMSAWLFVGFLVAGMLSPIDRLGGPTWVAIGLMLSSLVMAAGSLVSLGWFGANVRQAQGRFVRVVGTLFVAAQLLVVIYLGWFGVLGIRAWA